MIATASWTKKPAFILAVNEVKVLLVKAIE